MFKKIGNFLGLCQDAIKYCFIINIFFVGRGIPVVVLIVIVIQLNPFEPSGETKKFEITGVQITDSK